MSARDDGGPAFPRFGEPGMSLRDWFAGQAIIGFIAEREQRKAEGRMWPMAATMATDAFDIADAMLAERAK